MRIAAPEKRVFHSVVHDFEPGFDTYTEKPGYRVQADLGLTRLSSKSMTAWFCQVAGHLSICGTGRKAVSIVRHFSNRANRSQQIATDRCCCWWPASVKGRTMTCYPELEPDIRAAGANS